MLEKFLTRMGREEKGFTLIELLIVVAIIGILAAIAIPNFLNARSRATLSAVKADVKNLSTALETYQADNSIYPPTLAGLEPDYMTVVPGQPTPNGAYRYCVGSSQQSFKIDTDGDLYGAGTQVEVYVANGSGVQEAAAGSNEAANCPNP